MKEGKKKKSAELKFAAHKKWSAYAWVSELRVRWTKCQCKLLDAAAADASADDDAPDKEREMNLTEQEWTFSTTRKPRANEEKKGEKIKMK